MSHCYDGPKIQQRGPKEAPGKHPPYRFIEDPGHGWLEVTEKELLDLGIAHLISRFSYTTGHRKGTPSALVYLEEDCDLARFADAKGWTVLDAARYWRSVYQENTFVRNLPSYKAPAAPGKAADLRDEMLTLRAADMMAMGPPPEGGDE